MSVSLWAYEPSICDGNACPGDCDLCSKAFEDEEEIQGFDYAEEQRVRESFSYRTHKYDRETGDWYLKP